MAGVLAPAPATCCAVVRLLPLLVAAALASPTSAKNCLGTSTGFTPLDDLGAGSYLGFQGGLYPGGANIPPAVHLAEGVARATAMEPLDTAGAPSPAGRHVLLSIGMSNTTQEFCSPGTFEPCNAWTFMGQAAVHPDVNDTTLAIANGARGGQTAAAWSSPDAANYDFVRDQVLAPKGLSEAQVQVVWVKQANTGPTQGLADPSPDAVALEATLGDIVRAVAVRYPNAKLVLLSSRIYAGYADSPLDPEPYAYESAFAVKWLIEAQIDQLAGGGVDPVAGDVDYAAGTAPWLGWAAYLWADGTTPRSDGLTWLCDDFESDGTHPAQPAEQKVGSLLLDAMLTSPVTAPWFAKPGAPSVPALPPAGGVLIVGLVLATLRFARPGGGTALSE